MTILEQNSFFNYQEAEYKDPIIDQFQGNPVIEALPAPKRDAEIYKVLSQNIDFDPKTRSWPSEYRYDNTMALNVVFQPWGKHIEIARKLALAIKSGYVGRNPLAPGFYQDLTTLANCVENRTSSFDHFAFTNSRAPGFSIIGASGTGKTSAIQRILRLMFPQKILHKKYHGIDFNHLQIVWMQITCPYDGSVKGFCIQFFEKFCEITGDNTYHKFVRNRSVSIDLMLAQMSLLARRHSLGCLVIDEIQNVNSAKAGGRERLLAFLANMMDTLGIPIVVIGIESAIEALSATFMNARRNTGEQGAVFMQNLPFGEKNDWSIFVNGIWKYQWTNIYTPLTDDLSKALHAACEGGNVSLAVFIYQWVQRRAIKNGEYGGVEMITPQLIREVASSEDILIEKRRLVYMDTKEGNDERKTAYDLQYQAKENYKEELGIRPAQKQERDPAIKRWTEEADFAGKLKDNRLLAGKDDEF